MDLHHIGAARKAQDARNGWSGYVGIRVIEPNQTMPMSKTTQGRMPGISSLHSLHPCNVQDKAGEGQNGQLEQAQAQGRSAIPSCQPPTGPLSHFLPTNRVEPLRGDYGYLISPAIPANFQKFFSVFPP